MKAIVQPSCDTCAIKAQCNRPSIRVVSVSKKKWLQSMLEAEVLVIPRFSASTLGAPLVALDEALGGQISRRIDESQFRGKLGEKLSLDVNKDGSGLKQVVLIGLGEPGGVERYHLCAFYRAAIEESVAQHSNTVTLPVLPGQLSETSLQGMLAILSCRTHYAPSARGVNKEVVVLCTPQAKKHVEKGVESFRQLCYRCTDPHFDGRLPVVNISQPK